LVLVAGFWVLASGLWLLVSGFWMLVAGCWFHGPTMNLWDPDLAGENSI
jgi:hypothetical protein